MKRSGKPVASTSVQLVIAADILADTLRGGAEQHIDQVIDLIEVLSNHQLR